MGSRKSAKRQKKSAELFHVDITADTRAFQRALEQVSLDAASAGQRFAEFAKWTQTQTSGMNWTPTKAGKRITEIVFETETEAVDVTTLQDANRVFIPGVTHVTITDQDGEMVPPKLHRQLLDLYENRTETHTEDIKRVLAEWNDDGPEPKAYAPIGHKNGCPYRGSHHFSCTCQPPSLFGTTKLWYCDCCERPRALTQYGLCEICEGHQYSSGHVADAEHEAM